MFIREAAAPALRVRGFRVSMFRSVRDSGFAPIADLTALVGRERSGKTTLLHALCGVDPTWSAPYSIEDDWPQRRRPNADATQVVCAVQLQFSSEARDELLNDGLIEDDTIGVLVARSYDNSFHIQCLSRFDDPGHADEQACAPGHVEDEARDTLHAFVLREMPAFVFADEKIRLPDAIPLDRLRALADERAATGTDESEVSGLRSLALLIDAAASRVCAGCTLDQPGELRHVEAALNSDLGALGVDRRIGLTFDRGLVRLSMESSGAMRPLARTTLAWQFCLSLDLRIAAIRSLGQRAPVLLLDAPERAFRGGLKRKMRAVLSDYAAAGVTVIYTTRLPFYLQLQHPEQVLVLSPPSSVNDGEWGTKLETDGFEVMASLGMQGRSSYRIDEFNLVVEGPTDVTIIGALSALFARSGGPSIPHDVNVVSAGGAFEVAEVSAFLARQGLGVVALFDSDRAGDSGSARLDMLQTRESWKRPVRALALASAAGIDGDVATIEDLFPGSLYLEAVSEVVGRAEAEALADHAARGGGSKPMRLARSLKRLVEARGRRYPKVEIDRALSRRLLAMESADELDRETRDRATSLLAALVEALDAIRNLGQL